MSQILVIRTVAPHWPATTENPAAQRYEVGGYVVDAIGRPTIEEIDAVLAIAPQAEAERDAKRAALDALDEAALVKAMDDPASPKAVKDYAAAHRR